MRRMALGAGAGVGMGVLAGFAVSRTLEDSGLAFVAAGSLGMAIGVLVALFWVES